MANEDPQQALSLAAFVDSLQASGRYTFTRAEAERDSNLEGGSLEAGLRRLRTRGRIASPRRGFHVIVPIEYQAADAPPATWFIEDLMRFLEQPYYVGLLSAAALHGAAHQQPMAFQVVTDRPTRPARAGRSRIDFHAARNLAQIPVTLLPTETGTMRVSTPEATAFDLVRFAKAAGHLNNVATALAELAERLLGVKLASLAPVHALPDVQRLGYLLERVGERDKTTELLSWLKNQRVRPVTLARGRARGNAEPSGVWRVIPNIEIEVDR